MYPFFTLFVKPIYNRRWSGSNILRSNFFTWAHLLSPGLWPRLSWVNLACSSLLFTLFLEFTDTCRPGFCVSILGFLLACPDPSASRLRSPSDCSGWFARNNTKKRVSLLLFHWLVRGFFVAMGHKLVARWRSWHWASSWFGSATGNPAGYNC